MEVVRANGLKIAYERVGDGSPLVLVLVLVHGAGADSRMWQPQLRNPGGRVHGRGLGRAGRGPL